MQQSIRPIIILALLFFLSCTNTQKSAGSIDPIDPYNYAITKSLEVSNGAVVSAHPLASAVGLQILKKGGNAIDAVIAMQLALAVVYPAAGNLGGGGFLVAQLQNGKQLAVDYREMAPSLATRDMYVDADGKARTDKSQDGHLSSGVPGTVAGLFECHKYGKLPFSELIEPAIELAEKGFRITGKEAASLNSIQGSLAEFNTVIPVFVKGAGWKEGDTLVQKDLASTLKRIKEKGMAGFYEGETARLIVDEMKRGHGILTLEDLKNYKAKPRPAYHFSYKGYEVLSMPLPSSGGVLLNQMMKMIEDRNISSMGFQSEASVQLMVEVEKRAFADRGEYMGDADFYKAPVDMITNDVYLQTKMKDFKPGYATPSSEIRPGILLKAESEQTTHLNVIDKDGNAVAVTITLNNSFGSRTVVGGAGFFLNDEMDDFSIKPGVPNMFGAIGGDANSIAPGKRMLSSMTPTIVLKNGKPFIITGTPGGTTIPTSVFQTLVNLIEFDLSAEDAINKPKFHHQWLPDTLEIEKGFPDEVKQKLEAMGYKIRMRSAIGRTELILRLSNGKYKVIADSRGEDDAEGY